MTYNVALSLGANIDPERYIVNSLLRINQQYELESISPVYETEPVGMEDGASRFHNLCVLIETEQSPRSLKNSLRSIEDHFGRDRTEMSSGGPYQSRTIDIDILHFDPEPEEDGFSPSEELTDVSYVVYPLSDLVDPPEVLHYESVDSWRKDCPGQNIVRKVPYDWPETLEPYVVE